MTARKPLVWYQSDLGPVPDCVVCMDRLTTPGFVEAVYSVAIEHPGDPLDLARRVIDRYHANRHKETP